MMGTTAEPLPLDKLARVYTKIRAAMQLLEADFEEKKKALDEQRQAVANAMKEQMQALGIETSKTEFGTIVLSRKVRYYTQDWDSFNKFVIAQGESGLALFEKRLHQTNMAQFLKDNPEVVPPGLNSDSEVVVAVRKPTK